MDVKDEDWSNSRFERVRLNGSRFVNGGMLDVEIRGAALHRARLVGVELVDVEISGDVENVLVNGVDIGPLVEAELDRRDPERVLMRSTDAEGLRQAWQVLLQRWDEAMATARSLPETALHEQVDGEWSFIQTLRHLGFATAEWLGVMVMGTPSPWRPLDLAWDEAPRDVVEALRQHGIRPEDRDRRVGLDEAYAGRAARQRAMTGYLAHVSADDLATVVQRDDDLAFVHDPITVGDCLRIVLNEEYHHHRYATRDLAVLVARQPIPIHRHASKEN